MIGDFHAVLNFNRLIIGMRLYFMQQPHLAPPPLTLPNLPSQHPCFLYQNLTEVITQVVEV